MLNEKIKKIVHNKIEYYRSKHFAKINFSWWKIAISLFFSGFILYYFIIAAIISDIDKNLKYEIKTELNALHTVELSAKLINREINEKLWTPNLPFFFPTYFLDNMPNFQLGIIEATSNVINSLATTSIQQNANLIAAADFLKYSGKIWMFAPNNSLTPVPSANNQYKKARKNLMKFNQALSNNTTNFNKSATSLKLVLNNIKNDLNLNTNNINSQISEEKKSLWDNKADDIFYYNQGKIYAYTILLKTLAKDYKEVLINYRAYADFTAMIKALQDGVMLNPIIIRNAQPDATFGANHLGMLGFYMLRAQNKIITLEELLK